MSNPKNKLVHEDRVILSLQAVRLQLVLTIARLDKEIEHLDSFKSRIKKGKK